MLKLTEDIVTLGWVVLVREAQQRAGSLPRAVGHVQCR